MVSATQTPVEHRLDAEGIDPLLLAGVRDQNLLELSRIFGLRVVMRSDQIILSGGLDRIEAAVPLIQHLIELARMRAPFDASDVSRMAEDFQRRGGELPSPTEPEDLRIALPASRKIVAPKRAGQPA